MGQRGTPPTPTPGGVVVVVVGGVTGELPPGPNHPESPKGIIEYTEGGAEERAPPLTQGDHWELTLTRTLRFLPETARGRVQTR